MPPAVGQPRLTDRVGVTVAIASMVAILTGAYMVADYMGRGDAGFGPGPAALFDAGGNEPYHAIGELQLWRVVTAVFLHADPFHLGSNLLWLTLLIVLLTRLRLARAAEALTIAFSAAVLGHLVSALLSPGMSVGASGGAFGLLGLAFYRGGVSPPPRVEAWHRWSLLIVGLLGVVAPLASRTGVDVDHAAHLGGFAAGVGLGLTAWGTDRRSRWAVSVLAMAALIAHLLSGALASPYPVDSDPAAISDELRLPRLGQRGWLDGQGRCASAAPPPDAAAVECRLLPHQAAALAGSVSDIVRSHPELKAHIPAGNGCHEGLTHEGRSGEHVLTMRHGDAAMLLLARQDAWRRLEAVRHRLRSGRCPGTGTPAP